MKRQARSSSRATRSVVAAALCSIVLAVGSSSAWALADPSPIVAGVAQVVWVGTPSPLLPLAEEWVPLVGGDDDTSFPNLVVAAREYGAGRVVAFGHGGLLGETGPLDNNLSLRNPAAWLDVPGGKRIGYTTGHAEWVHDGGPNGWAAALAPHGYTTVAIPGQISASALANVDVLIVGEAGAVIHPAEVEAVRQWVEAGHGLLMVGVAWFWDQSHPGKFESFPMNVLAASYGLRWAHGGMSDPTNNLDGSPSFHTFYPDVLRPDRAASIAAIDGAHLAHGDALPAVLEADAAKRFAFVRAHQMLALFCRELPLGHPLRQTVFDDLAGLAARESFYWRTGPFEAATPPTAAWVRERMLRGWIDCLGLPPPMRVQIADALHMAGTRRDVLVDLGVAMHDNDRMQQWHLDYVQDFLPLVPEGLTDLRAITVTNLLGVPAMHVGLEGAPQSFNIWVTDDVGNEFPPDVEPSIANGTAVILAHEMNHQVPGVGDELVAPCSQNRIRSNRVAVDPSQRSRLDRRDRGERASLSLRDRRCGAGHRLRRRRRAVCGAAAGRARSHRPRWHRRRRRQRQRDPVGPCDSRAGARSDRKRSPRHRVRSLGRARRRLPPRRCVRPCHADGMARKGEPVDVRERFLDRRRLQPRHGAHPSQG